MVQVLRDEPLALSSFPERRTEMDKERYRILDNGADRMRGPPGVRHVLKHSNSFEATTLEELEWFILEAFPEGKVLERIDAVIMKLDYHFRCKMH